MKAVRKDNEQEATSSADYFRSISTSRTTEELKYQFNEHELTDRKHDLANLDIKLEDKEEELKDISSTLRAEIKDIKKLKRGITKDIRSGYEMREFEVWNCPDYDTNTMNYVKVGTDEVVGSRPLTYNERTERRLPFPNTED